MTKILVFGGIAIIGLFILMQALKSNGVGSSKQLGPPIVPSNPRVDGWVTNVTAIAGVIPGLINAWRGSGNTSQPGMQTDYAD